MNDGPAGRASAFAHALNLRVREGNAGVARLFGRAFGCQPGAMDPLELSYFTASLTTFIQWRFGSQGHDKAMLDEFTRLALDEAIRRSHHHPPFSTVASTYAQRFAEYNARVARLFNPDETGDGGDPAAALLAHAFGCITHGDARDMGPASAWLLEFLLDLVVFVKQES